MVRFVRHVTAQEVQVAANARVVKTWLVRNDSDKAWMAGCELVHVGGDMFGFEPIAFEPARVGEEVELSVAFTAPSKAGMYECFWRLKEPQHGKKFGQRLKVGVVVVEGEVTTPASAAALAGNNNSDWVATDEMLEEAS